VPLAGRGEVAVLSALELTVEKPPNCPCVANPTAGGVLQSTLSTVGVTSWEKAVVVSSSAKRWKTVQRALHRSGIGGFIA
jgi:hypothetical protein